MFRGTLKSRSAKSFLGTLAAFVLGLVFFLLLDSTIERGEADGSSGKARTPFTILNRTLPGDPFNCETSSTTTDSPSGTLSEIGKGSKGAFNRFSMYCFCEAMTAAKSDGPSVSTRYNTVMESVGTSPPFFRNFWTRLTTSRANPSSNMAEFRCMSKTKAACKKIRV